MKLRHLPVLAGAALLGGCAGHPLMIDCDTFAGQLLDPPESNVLASIHTDLAPPDEVDDEGLVNALTKLIQTDTALQQRLFSIMSPAPLVQAQPNGDHGAQAGQTQSASGIPILLLSGGGQWGAFGAAFLEKTFQESPAELPPFAVVTGVSTGAMQALFLGQSNDPAVRSANLAAMVRAYTISDEHEIVNRRGNLGVVTKGAMADLGPLYQRIMNQLCPPGPGGTPSNKCPMVVQLTNTENAPTTLVGLVDAASGDFKYVSLNALARSQIDKRSDMPANRDRRERLAAQCLAGAVLSSSAMPVYYQQVMVGDADHGYHTYIDGGARNSVFLAKTARMFSSKVLGMAYASQAKLFQKRTGEVPANQVNAALVDIPSNIFIVRNGPTIARPADNTDQPWNALSAAERSYALLVNQSEVNSLAAVRLLQPRGRVRAITADGYDSNEWLRLSTTTVNSQFENVCEKRDSKAMFDPAFMECLRKFGAFKALLKRGSQKSPWIEISELEK